MKNGQFIGQFEKNITAEELCTVKRLVTESIESYGQLKVTDIEAEKAYAGLYLTFYVSGLDYVNRDRRQNTVTEIKKIYCYLTSQYGFDDYEKLKRLEAEGKKTVENADCSGYSLNFKTDGYYRAYRCKKFICLESKNHYLYNDDLNDTQLKEEIHSYFVNLFAMKNL